MRSDGTGQTRLTSAGGKVRAPVWSPDGAQIAFVRDSQIWLMDADGSHLERLTRGSWSAFPAWSPDGTRIAFVRDSQIWLMGADGSDRVRIAKDVTAQEGGPVWSPDGRRIAFVGRGVHIHTVNADGSGETAFESPPGWNPTWSPDGSWIAYWSSGEIYLVRPDGSASKRLTQTRSREERRPAWSPGGTRIAFAGRGPGYEWNLYVMDADGSNASLIAKGAHPDRGVFNGGGLLIWSPDGTKIAFTCGGEICVAAADGSAVRRLTDSSGRDEEPALSPDGTRIVFTSERDA